VRREDLERRRFLGTMAAASLSSLAARGARAEPQPAPPAAASGPGGPPVRFAVVGINHAHIYGQTDAVLRGGGELVALYAEEPDLVAAFQKKYPQARLARAPAVHGSAGRDGTAAAAASGDRRDSGQAAGADGGAGIGRTAIAELAMAIR